VPLRGLHDDRDRAESFGSVAELYDRLRPGYPAVFIDDLVALGRTSAVDVGCGTGKVARPLMQRGLQVLGVEPDEAMAAVARRHGIPLEVARFETWDAAGRTFDLLTAGHAWHWVDPVAGLAKAASVLVPGGTVALFWNYHVLDASLVEAFADVYAAHAPGLAVIGADPTGSPDVDPFSGSDHFAPGETRSYRWSREVAADDWVSMLETFSDHRRLGEAPLHRLQDGLHDVITASGGVVRSWCGTYAWLSRRVWSE
jgi:SAM-dependent methyltransferase